MNKRVRITKAQFRFLDTWKRTQDHWMKASGWAIGAVAESRRAQLSMNALIRKGLMENDGQITVAGAKIYDRRIKRMEGQSQ